MSPQETLSEVIGRWMADCQEMMLEITAVSPTRAEVVREIPMSRLYSMLQYGRRELNDKLGRSTSFDELASVSPTGCLLVEEFRRRNDDISRGMTVPTPQPRPRWRPANIEWVEWNND